MFKCWECHFCYALHWFRVRKGERCATCQYTNFRREPSYDRSYNPIAN